MGKFFLWFLLPVLVIVGFGYYTYKTTGYAFGIDKTILSKGTITITTQSFLNGKEIPPDFTCDGQNFSPSFFLEHVPDYAKSLVLLLDDQDSNPKNFTHWLAFNISPYTTSIEGAKAIGGATLGTNDYGNVEYDGPCPPIGQTHKYFFRIYALDTILNLDEGARRSDLDTAMKGHIIATGETAGIYGRVAN
jgi:Raf kinase inhibitor-like YbhB/YbcL family protein